MSSVKEVAFDTWRKLRALTLPRDDRMIGGVCAAFSRATPIPAWIWRAGFCTTALLWGVGIGVYVVLMLCIPDERKALRGKPQTLEMAALNPEDAEITESELLCDPCELCVAPPLSRVWPVISEIIDWQKAEDLLRQDEAKGEVTDPIVAHFRR